MAGTPPDSPSPFDDYHRARRRSAAGSLVAVGIVAAATITLTWAIGSGTSGRAVAAPIPVSAATAGPSGTPTPSARARAKTLPAMTAATVTTVSAPRSGRASVVHINVTATGYQRELDECQWVLMQLGAEAPIVGAHTQCGGSVALTMRLGDLVDVTGEGAAGSYVVTDLRLAHSGDDAATATEGMHAELILQTCYPGTGGRERLVGLEPRG